MKKGELQVGEKEREHDLTSLRKEIATLVAEKCVDPATQRPYPVGMIEKAMAEAGVSVKMGKNAKSQVGGLLASGLSFQSTRKQVSETLRLIQSGSKLPIQRARMRVRVAVPAADGEGLEERIKSAAEQVERVEKIGRAHV